MTPRKKEKTVIGWALYPNRHFQRPQSVWVNLTPWQTGEMKKMFGELFRKVRIIPY